MLAIPPSNHAAGRPICSYSRPVTRVGNYSSISRISRGTSGVVARPDQCKNYSTSKAWVTASCHLSASYPFTSSSRMNCIRGRSSCRCRRTSHTCSRIRNSLVPLAAFQDTAAGVGPRASPGPASISSTSASSSVTPSTSSGSNRAGSYEPAPVPPSAGAGNLGQCPRCNAAGRVPCKACDGTGRLRRGGYQKNNRVDLSRAIGKGNMPLHHSSKGAHGSKSRCCLKRAAEEGEFGSEQMPEQWRFAGIVSDRVGCLKEMYSLLC